MLRLEKTTDSIHACHSHHAKKTYLEDQAVRRVDAVQDVEADSAHRDVRDDAIFVGLHSAHRRLHLLRTHVLMCYQPYGINATNRVMLEHVDKRSADNTGRQTACNHASVWRLWFFMGCGSPRRRHPDRSGTFR
jgi:hypothetical protein